MNTTNINTDTNKVDNQISDLAQQLQNKPTNESKEQKPILSQVEILQNRINELKTKQNELVVDIQNINLDPSSEDFLACLQRQQELSKKLLNIPKQIEALQKQIAKAKQSDSLIEQIKDSSEYELFKEYLQSIFSGTEFKHFEIDFNIIDGNFNLYIDKGMLNNRRIRKSYKGKIGTFVTIEKPQGSYFKFEFNGQSYVLPTLQEIGKVLELTPYQTKFLSNASAYQTMKSIMKEKGIDKIDFSDANGNFVEKCISAD